MNNQVPNHIHVGKSLLKVTENSPSLNKEDYKCEGRLKTQSEFAQILIIFVSSFSNNDLFEKIYIKHSREFFTRIFNTLNFSLFFISLLEVGNPDETLSVVFDSLV